MLRANVFDPVRRQLALRTQIRAALAAVDLPRLRALRSRLDDISRELSAFARGYGWRAWLRPGIGGIAIPFTISYRRTRKARPRGSRGEAGGNMSVC